MKIDEFIAEQPEILEEVLAEVPGQLAALGPIHAARPIYLVGSGTSRKALAAVAPLLGRLVPAGVRVRGPLAFLAETAGARKGKGIAIFLSQTGTTSTTVQAVSHAASLGWCTLAFTADRRSPIGRASGEIVVIPVGREPVGPKTKGYTASVLTLVLLARPIAGDLISDGVVPDSRETKSNSIDPSSQWEMIIGYEQMVGTNWSVGARFINREFGKVIEDITIDQQLWLNYGVDCYNPDSDDFGSCAHEYRLTNPGEDFEGWYDLDGDGELDPISWSAGEGFYQEPERKYYAVELTANRRFADNWMLIASYTWSQSYGNYEGYVNSDIGQDDAGITQSFDSPVSRTATSASCRTTAGTTSSSSAPTPSTSASSSAPTPTSAPAGRSTGSAFTPPTRGRSGTARSPSRQPEGRRDHPDQGAYERFHPGRGISPAGAPAGP